MIDYTPWNETDYRNIFIHESKELIEIFRNEIVELHHYGSTSVQDMPGNKTVDILPVVKDLSRISQYIDRMTSIGYEIVDASQYTHDTAVMFVAKKYQLTFNVMMIERTDYSAIERRLAVRDYLREHKYERIAYAKFKVKQAMLYRNDYNTYKQAKKDYITKLESKALHWLQIVRG